MHTAEQRGTKIMLKIPVRPPSCQQHVPLGGVQQNYFQRASSFIGVEANKFLFENGLLFQLSNKNFFALWNQTVHKVSKNVNKRTIEIQQCTTIRQQDSPPA